MGKLDPTAYDRWWRARIEKEESTYVDSATQKPRKDSVKLNTLGAPQVVPAAAAESHLTGAAALVKTFEASPLELPALGGGGKAPSVAGSRASVKGGKAPSVARSTASYRHGGAAGSTASYPRTPQFSQAGSAADAEIVARLAFLERALKEEKSKREAAEQEMKTLITAANARLQQQ